MCHTTEGLQAHSVPTFPGLLNANNSHSIVCSIHVSCVTYGRWNTRSDLFRNIAFIDICHSIQCHVLEIKRVWEKYLVGH